MESLSDRQFEVLLKEYDLLQTRTKEYDARLFQIKGWSVTIYSAATGLSILNNKPQLLLIPLISSVIFWGLDALYKNFQYVFIDRTREVEAVFNGDCAPNKYGYLSTKFLELDKGLLSRIKRVGAKLFLFNVMALYLSKIIVLGIIWIVL